MQIFGKCLIGAAFMCASFVASATPGSPIDGFLGCDSVLGGHCQVSFDERGNISAVFDSFLHGTLSPVVASIAPASNPLWVDNSGNPLEVFSYSLQVQYPGPGGTNPGFNSGSVGLCEGAGCDAIANPLLSDVVLFAYDDASATLFIHLLSDVGFSFNFLTDVVIAEIGTEGDNGATWYANNPGVNLEDVFYVITSDARGDDANVPEPGTLALVGLGIAGVGLSRRRKQTFTA